ncbi:MAG: methyl-accepting chemotaxis protein [Firmicutes bacterium]|nr:methyl-accepting chemotaxis protein [Bacillota bacterium]
MFHSLVLAERNGQAVEALDGRSVYQGEADWFREIMAGREYVVIPSPPCTIYPDIGGRVMLAVPVKKDDQVYRVLSARITLADLSAYIAPMKPGEKGRAFVLDEKGIMIAHPSEDLRLLDATVESEKFPAVVAAGIRQMVAEKTGRVEYTFRGVDSLLFFHSVPVANWIIVLAAERAEFYAAVNNLMRILSVTIAGACLALLIIGWYATGKITRPLFGLNDAAGRLAQGDLSIEIKAETGDEVGQLAGSFEQMRLSLQQLIGNAVRTSARVTDTAKSLGEQAEHTASAAAENASTVCEVAAAIDQVAGNVKSVSSRAEKANQQADQARQNTIDVVKTMRDIDQAVGQAAASITELSQAIEEVGQFVTLIDGIAEQTNLLSLNAAIEAARAGEVGRGFAVVAEEVRKLAESSTRSAGEVKRIIIKVRQQASHSVTNMESSRKRVAQGDHVVQDVSKSLSTIIQLVQELTQEAQEAATAAGEVSGAVQNVAATTEEQTAAMEEVSASAAELDQIAAELDQILSKFRKG